MAGLFSFRRRLDGSSWIARPLAPRTRIQLRPPQAGVFERKQVVTRLDTRTAVTHDAIDRHVSEYNRPLVAQLGGRAKQPVLVEIPLEERIHRTRNMAGDAIERLDLAAIPLGRASVHQKSIAPACKRGDLRNADGHS